MITSSKTDIRHGYWVNIFRFVQMFGQEIIRNNRKIHFPPLERKLHVVRPNKNNKTANVEMA